MRVVLPVFTAFFLLLPMRLSAQPSSNGGPFLNANLAIQEGSRTLAVAVPADVFGSSGTLAIDDSLSGGPLVDVVAGARGRRFAFGVGYSRTRVENSLDLAASTIRISPGSFQRSVAGVTPDLVHDERAFYFSAGAIKQVTSRFDVTISAGPSFFRVRQALPDGVILAEPLGASIQHVSTRVVEESAIGLQASLDLNWMIRPRIGVGGLGRYSWGRIDLPDGTSSMTIGGVTIGGGLRVRF
jgi:hypothetical protein